MVIFIYGDGWDHSGWGKPFNLKVIMFLKRKYSVRWISLDDDRPFLGIAHHVYYCRFLYGLPVFLVADG